MPWTMKDVDQHHSGLTKAQKQTWVDTANSVLAQCKKEKGKDCDAKAIRIANSTVKESAMILEKGATFNKSHRTILQQVRDLINSLKIDNEEDTETSEAATWSTGDVAASISKALKGIAKYGYLLDIFPEENLAVYQTGWSDSRFFQCTYSLDDTGTCTLGDPEEVNRKVSYVPVSKPNPIPAHVMPEESADLEINGDSITLVERAVNDNGITMLKLISPGLGSSGYYSPQVLKQAVANHIFSKGLHNLIDHPTPQEESARPEGSLEKLGGTLVEDATWLDRYVDSTGLDHGAGVYAKARVSPDFKEKLNVVAGDIGVSIRARGKAHMGTIDGKQVPIIDAIEQARSVDYVTLPGRGGKVLELVESKRGNTMADETIINDEVKRLQEANQTLATQVARLLEAQALQQAQQQVANALRSYPTLPRATKERILRAVPSMVVLGEHGTLDTTKLEESLKNTIATETAYLSTMGIGDLTDLGGKPVNEASTTDYEKQIEENLKLI